MSDYNEKKTFTVVGMGYVGASSALFLAQKHEVNAVDISRDRIDSIKQRKSPVADKDMDRLFSDKRINIRVSANAAVDYIASDFILISTPTNYDENKGMLDTSTVERVVRDITASGSRAVIIVKSTVPIGFMDKIHKEYPDNVFLYVPEFLREGNAMKDQLNPSRIVIGVDKNNEESKKAAGAYIKILKACLEKDEVPILTMEYGEAESVKLFSNAYLAMRVAFFNEIDSFAETDGYDAKVIIDGVCLEPRIGDYYNNPSFGYGGYCLPKDTKQLLSDFGSVPQNLIGATIESNETRMEFIANNIFEKIEPIRECNNKYETSLSELPRVGVYRLIMKSGSRNCRESSVLSIIKKLINKGVKITIYEPLIDEIADLEVRRIIGESGECEVVNDLKLFKDRSNLIIANRIDSELDDVSDKVYTRDIYQIN